MEGVLVVRDERGMTYVMNPRDVVMITDAVFSSDFSVSTATGIPANKALLLDYNSSAYSQCRWTTLVWGLFPYLNNDDDYRNWHDLLCCKGSYGFLLRRKEEKTVNSLPPKVDRFTKNCSTGGVPTNLCTRKYEA